VIVPDWLKAEPVARLNVLPEAKQLVQPTTFLSNTGIVTQATRRPLLNSTVGRGRP
jgi:hypothetical protein